MRRHQNRRPPDRAMVARSLAALERLFAGLPKTKAAPGQGNAAIETNTNDIVGRAEQKSEVSHD